MMPDPVVAMTAASVTLLGLSLASAAGLKAWNGWLKVRRLELGRCGRDDGRSAPAARTEVADLEERVRKLEAIALGLDI